MFKMWITKIGTLILNETGLYLNNQFICSAEESEDFVKDIPYDVVPIGV